MEKPLVELCEFSGIGLLVEYPSGIRYTNQIGGYACLHPEVEGIFIPLTNSLVSQQEKLKRFFTGPKWKGHCDHGIDKETADFVEAVLTESFCTAAIRVNQQRLADSYEAWIHVIVSPDGQPSEMWRGLNNMNGIITWENSD